MQPTGRMFVSGTLMLCVMGAVTYGCGGGGNNLQSKTAASKVKASAVKRDATADPQFYTSPDAVPGTYIVSFTDAAAAAPAQNANAAKTGPQTSATAPQPVPTPPDPATETSVANDLVTQYGGQVAEVWGASTSFLATNMTDAQAIAMSHDSRVAFVCADAPGLSSSTTQVLNLPGIDQTALDRIDQPANNYNHQFSYNSTGQTVNVYVTDTGIRLGHPEFQGRADSVYVAISGYPSDDVNGHGTACASLIGGMTTGVAKNVRLHSVKIEHDDGTGYWSDAIRGFDWISQHAVKPAVVSCSNGSNGVSHGAYGAEKALHNLINTGVTCVVAAGNAGIDAVNATYSKVDQAIVVGASDENDARSIYGGNAPNNTGSNFGSLITVFAPGTTDYAANVANSSLVRYDGLYPDHTYFGGTSAATPLVAGVAALYLQTHPNARHEEVKAWLINNATLGKLTNLPAGSNTPNRLLFTNL